MALARDVHVAGAAFAAGSVLFCGSLYALALTGVRELGVITPIGGVLYLLGWLLLLWRGPAVLARHGGDGGGGPLLTSVQQ